MVSYMRWHLHDIGVKSMKGVGQMILPFGKLLITTGGLVSSTDSCKTVKRPSLYWDCK